MVPFSMHLDSTYYHAYIVSYFSLVSVPASWLHATYAQLSWTSWMCSSGKCQIIHWRQDHKDRCQPWNTSATPSGVAPQQMPYLVNLNSPLHGSESEQSMLSDGTYDDQSGTQTDSKFINYPEKRSTSKLKQVKFRTEEWMEADPLFSEVLPEVCLCFYSFYSKIVPSGLVLAQAAFVLITRWCHCLLWSHYES